MKVEKVQQWVVSALLLAITAFPMGALVNADRKLPPLLPIES